MIRKYFNCPGHEVFIRLWFLQIETISKIKTVGLLSMYVSLIYRVSFEAWEKESEGSHSYFNAQTIVLSCNSGVISLHDFLKVKNISKQHLFPYFKNYINE